VNIDLHFTAEDWTRTERDWTAWWEGELERPLVLINDFVRPDKPLPEAHLFTSNFPLGMPTEEVVERLQPYLEATRFYGDSFPRWWPNFGPGIMAGFLGAKVHTARDTVWFEPSQVVEISELRPSYDPDNVWWKRVRDVTTAAVQRWGGQVVVGHTDLGGNLDILASLRTTEPLLLDVHDAPDEVMRLVGEITHLWLRYYDELYEIIGQGGRGTTPWAPVWSPHRCYMLQCDFSYMISPAMFERFVMPDLAACCDALDHAFYHLDGKGQIPHLDMLLSMERLRGIQWIPGDGAPPPERWLPLLRRIREGGKLCQLFVTAEGAMTIVRELGGRGFAFEITELMSQERAAEFLTALAAADPITHWTPG
jgi:5-methyltetrahydrofolate--homocysteine methyltransferase